MKFLHNHIALFFNRLLKLESRIMKEDEMSSKDTEEKKVNYVDDDNIVEISEINVENELEPNYNENVNETKKSSEIAEIKEVVTTSDSLADKDKMDTDKVFLSTLQECGDGYVIGASIRGRSHETHDMPCQDYHSYDEIARGWYVLSVSDGAGSAICADRGAKANSDFSVRLIKQMVIDKHWVENDYFPTELEWYIEVRAIFERIKLIIKTKILELDDEYRETDFNATLLVALITPKGVLSAHIGDGRMGYLSVDDEWKAMMVPHKGEEANQTLFLQSAWSTPLVPAFNMKGVYVPEISVMSEVPKAVVLMSDGCERASWECLIMDEEQGKFIDKNIPHKGFMNPLIDSLNCCNYDDKLQLFVDILDHGTPVCERELDDKTMLLAVLK